MYLINLDENKRYEFEGEKYAEDIMYNMFFEYFERTYTEDAASNFSDDIWENVKMQIPKYVMFLKKDKMLYYIEIIENTDKDEYEDEFVRIEIAPRSFFKIKKNVHRVLKECFDECNRKFEKTMQNISSETGWKSTTFTMMNLRYDEESEQYEKWKCEDLQKHLIDKQKNFKKFARGGGLKGRLCEEVVSNILEKYRNILLANNPIMFITNVNTEEIYSVDKDLVAKKISFFSIREYLEEIIGEILPRDYDFLVNRIYNYIIFPKEGIPAQMRIKKVNKNGLSGVFYGEEETFPIVRSKRGNYYTIIPIKSNEDNVYKIRQRFGYCSSSPISLKNSSLYTNTINLSIKN